MSDQNMETLSMIYFKKGKIAVLKQPGVGKKTLERVRDYIVATYGVAFLIGLDARETLEQYGES